MENHEYPMSRSVSSRETDAQGLFYALDGRGIPTNAVDLGIDVDDVEESAREALYAYPLAVETSTVLTVTLAVGGPTAYMSATITRDDNGTWERTSRIDYVDSWAVPSTTSLDDDSSLARLFDEYVGLHVA